MSSDIDPTGAPRSARIELLPNRWPLDTVPPSSRPATCKPVRCPYTASMRTQRLELRLTDEERSIDQAAAAAVGESLSDFFRRAAANRAADVLADQRRIAL